jgi:hypothetical protein
MNRTVAAAAKSDGENVTKTNSNVSGMYILYLDRKARQKVTDPA